MGHDVAGPRLALKCDEQSENSDICAPMMVLHSCHVIGHIINETHSLCIVHQEIDDIQQYNVLTHLVAINWKRGEYSTIIFNTICCRRQRVILHSLRVYTPMK